MKYLPQLPLLALMLTGACGGGDDASPDSPDGGTSDPLCQDQVQTVDLQAEWLSSSPGSFRLAAYRVGAASATDGRLSVPLSVHRPDDALELSVLDATASLSPLADLADTGTGYVLSSAAVAMAPGLDCVLYQPRDSNLLFTCSDGTTEDVGDKVYSETMLPVLWSDGTLSVFTRTYASFTEFRRSPSGSWSEVEKYESSISGPRDALVHDGIPAVCFVANSGRAVIQFGASEMRSSVDVDDCSLVDDGTSLHVLTDQGYAAIEWSMMPSAQSFELSPSAHEGEVLALVIIDREAQVVSASDDGTSIEVTAVRSGEKRVLASLPTDYRSVQAKYDAQAEILHIVTSTLEDSRSPEPAKQTIQIDSLCIGS